MRVRRCPPSVPGRALANGLPSGPSRVQVLGTAARQRAGIDLLIRSTMSGGTKFTSSVDSASTSST